jgi:hypothetical protein
VHELLHPLRVTYLGGILSGKINFGKSSAREKFCILGVWKGKIDIGREAPKKFLDYIFGR